MTLTASWIALTCTLFVASTSSASRFEVPFVLPEIAGAGDRVTYVVGLPLPRGWRAATTGVTVRGPLGHDLPAHVRPALAERSPAGQGPRWIAVSFEGRPGARGRLRLVTERASSSAAPWAAVDALPDASERFHAVHEGRIVRVQTERLSFRIDPEQGPLPIDLHLDGAPILPGEGLRLEWRRPAGRVGLSTGPPPRLKVEEVTPGHLTIHAEGRALASGRGLGYRLRISVPRAEPRMHLRLSVAPLPHPGRNGGSRTEGALVFVVQPALKLPVRGRLGRDEPIRLAPDRALTASLDEDGYAEVAEAGGGSMRSVPSGRAEPSSFPGGATLTGARHSVRLAVRHLAERYPKELRATARGIECTLLPEGSRWLADGARRFDATIDFAPQPTAPPTDFRPVPVPATVDPAWYRGHALPWSLRARRDRSLALYEKLESRILRDAEAGRRRALGEWNFGDWPLFDGFGNLEFDTAAGYLLSFYRTGDGPRRARAEEGVLHWADVDCVRDRDDPAFGLPRVHGTDHGVRVEPGHVWLDGAFHTAALTADPFLRESCEEAAQATVAHLSTRLVREGERLERDVAWSLHSLSAVHEATGCPRAAAQLRDLSSTLLETLDPVTGLPAVERHTHREITRYRSSPWLTLGVLVPGMLRAAETLASPELRRSAIDLAKAVRDLAIEPRGAGIRAFIRFGGPPGLEPERGPLRLGELSLFAARGLVEAGLVSGDARILREGRDLAHRSLEALVARRRPLDGRERARILLNAPHTLLRHR